MLRITEQVEQHLHQPPGIDPNQGNRVVADEFDLDLPTSRRQSLQEQLDRLVEQRRQLDVLRMRRAVAHGRHQMIEPELKQLRIAENRINPLMIFALRRIAVMREQLGAAADHRERPANLVHDSGQKAADLDELLIEHRHAGHLAKLNQAAHPAEHDGAGRIFGDIVVSPGFETGENVGIVVADGQASRPARRRSRCRRGWRGRPRGRSSRAGSRRE